MQTSTIGSCPRNPPESCPGILSPESPRNPSPESPESPHNRFVSPESPGIPESVPGIPWVETPGHEVVHRMHLQPAQRVAKTRQPLRHGHARLPQDSQPNV